MIENYTEIIDNMYKVIVSGIDTSFKKNAISYYKKRLNIDVDDLLYEHYGDIHIKNKSKGSVYTPEEISKYIIENTIDKETIIHNPFIKIIDPSCGCGNILIPCFYYIKEIYKYNLEEINNRHALNLTSENIEEHIITNNIYGFDIDELALKIVKIDLFYISGCTSENLKKRDFLVEDIEGKFDVFVGNPPYVGHKMISKEYSLLLKKRYVNIYKDKGDMSYCFFQRALEKLNSNGKLTFITSRYFLESLSGEEMRKFLKTYCSVDKIIDFYGIRPFKGVGVDPIIIFIAKENNNNDIRVIKPKLKTKKKEFIDSLILGKENNYMDFFINKGQLSDKGWILRNKEERNIINKIEEKSFTNLSNICDSYQGIITGCDKAFVVNEEIIASKNLERDIIKPWIKSSQISSYEVKPTDKYIIYSDLISESEINKYKNCINYISVYKDKLLNRRECIKGMRNWYQLQWGRNLAMFEKEKIIFPYKSNKNRFSLDKGSLFSADVYGLLLKENVPFTYDYLLFLLNSRVYEFYFKTFGKKLGETLYEYYPNNLMKLCVPVMENIGEFKEENLYKYFKFTDREVILIKEGT